MPSMQNRIRIGPGLSIPASELQFQFSRSGGPGGQNVNKVSSRVVVLFDVRNSPSLTEGRKEKITAVLKSRIGTDGILRLTAQESRSQWRNRERVVQTFMALVEKALRPEKKRIRTKVSAAVREKRLETKKRRAGKKERRKRVSPDV